MGAVNGREKRRGHKGVRRLGTESRGEGRLYSGRLLR